jgi:hypothetical protein
MIQIGFPSWRTVHSIERKRKEKSCTDTLFLLYNYYTKQGNHRIYEVIPDNVVNNNGVRWMKQWIQALGDFCEFHPLTREDLFQVLVTVDELALMGIL